MGPEPTLTVQGTSSEEGGPQHSRAEEGTDCAPESSPGQSARCCLTRGQGESWARGRTSNPRPGNMAGVVAVAVLAQAPGGGIPHSR